MVQGCMMYRQMLGRLRKFRGPCGAAPPSKALQERVHGAGGVCAVTTEPLPVALFCALQQDCNWLLSAASSVAKALSQLRAVARQILKQVGQAFTGRSVPHTC